MKNFDFVVVGAGVVGLAIARQIKIQFPGSSLLVLEKESSVGEHASGKNSGVLHAGIYYPPGTLKAKLCVDGARRLAAYCEENRLGFKRCGKVILPLAEEEDSQLDLLLERAQKNGVRVELLDEKSLKEREPACRSLTGRALFSPNTAIFDSKAILKSFLKDLEDCKAHIFFSEKVLKVDTAKKEIKTDKQVVGYGHLINAAGAYADTIARFAGGSTDFTLLPFRGIYWSLKDSLPFRLNGLVYPVPNLRVPFLGVHLTLGIRGDVTIGPNALPAISREAEIGLKNFRFSEAVPIFYHLGRQYLDGKQGFRHFAHQELLNLSKKRLVGIARSMVPQIELEHLGERSKVGIRAQIYNRKTRELEMDFLVERTKNETHILNAVSPGFTSALSFSSFVISEFLESAA